MSKLIGLIAIAGIGLLFIGKRKPSIALTTSDKKKAIIKYIGNEADSVFLSQLNSMTESETALIYEVIILRKYGTGGIEISYNMPKDVRIEWLLLSEKYNIFT